uniref:DUF1725 domain-containing protein n=1 Tax=Equus caballus TaxID=9796 RepID=A0A9L0STI6_HORSE
MVIGNVSSELTHCICTPMFIAALLTTAKRWKKPACPLTNEGTNKMWYIHNTMEYYSALKRKEILSHAATWMNLEDVTLSGISQSQKDKHCMIPLTLCGISSSQIPRNIK